MRQSAVNFLTVESILSYKNISMKFSKHCIIRLSHEKFDAEMLELLLYVNLKMSSKLFVLNISLSELKSVEVRHQ